jgi:hypothetical protein
MTVPFLKIKTGQCRFLLDDFMPERVCCGDITIGASYAYCREHHTLTHISRAVRKMVFHEDTLILSSA